jgi:HSP20 family molecular chaperone IbpA
VVQGLMGADQVFKPIGLPVEVAADQVTARIENGILEIKLPKKNREPSGGN